MCDTTHLILNGVNKASHISKVAIMNLLKQGLLFGMEDMCHQIRLIHNRLTYNGNNKPIDKG